MTDDGPAPDPESEPPKRRRKRRAATVEPALSSAEQTARMIAAADRAFLPESYRRTVELLGNASGKEGVTGLGAFAEKIGKLGGAGTFVDPKLFESLHPKGALGAELLKSIEANDARYSDLITQASGTATAAHELARPFEPFPVSQEPIRQTKALEAVERHIVRVGETVAAMADTVQPMLEVARDANEALLRLEATAVATIEAINTSAGAADKAARSLVTLTWVLTAATVVIGILTLVLVLRGAG